MQQDCPACRIGDHRMCPQTDLFVGKRRVGLVPANDGSGLHGGNAEYMQLSANSLVYRLPADLDADLAAWTQPFANALDWTVDAGGAEEGSTVVIIGPGYHGISAVAAARAVGAARIVVIGVPESAGRLEIAESLGAVPVINDNDDLAELILRATGGEGADVLLDTVGLGGQAVAAARVLRKRGRLVIGGLGRPRSANSISNLWCAAPTPSSVSEAALLMQSHAASNFSPAADPDWRSCPPSTSASTRSTTCWGGWPPDRGR